MEIQMKQLQSSALTGMGLALLTLTDAGAAALTPKQLQVNDRPCGADTIAVINTERKDRYIFCSSKEGTAVIEVLSPRAKRISLLDSHADPLDLAAAVLPKKARLPEDILLAIGTGERPALRLDRPLPFTVGTADYAAADWAGQEKAACATPSNGGFDMSEFINDDTFCGIVQVSSTSSGNTQWHQHYASALDIAGEGSHAHAGPHEPGFDWFADEQEQGDARYGRARVQSCGGTTQFRGWVKASATSGSWGELAEYFVPSGSTYLMKWYSNPFHSLWMGYDADDIRFRADALDGASFGSRFYFVKYAWGTQCDMVF
jgi:hypothetical protein